MSEDGNQTPVDLETTQSLNANGKRALEATSSAKKAKANKAKRVRVSRACDQCRAGREKCDGAQPICHTCQTQSRACTYHEQPKKRGIQPNYIRTLELTLAWILQHFPDSGLRLSQLLPRPHEQAHRLISFKDATAAETLHTAWRNGIVSRQIEQLLSGNDVETPQASSSREVDMAPYQSPPLSAPSDTGVIRSDQQESGTEGTGVLHARQTLLSHVAAHEALVLPQNSWNLLEHYFTFTQTWLPITEKHDIMRLMYSYPSHGLLPRDDRAAEHAELWSIMAWSAFSIGSQSDLSFEKCHGIAKSLIPAGHGMQLGHVKALLILGIIELARDSFLAAWLTIGSAVRVLTHYQPGQGLQVGLGGTRTKHTVLAAFLLEQVVASHSRAVGHLKHDDVRALGLLVEDGLEEWEPWTDPAARSSSAKAPARSISTFNALVRLALQATHSDSSAVQSLTGSSELGVVLSLLRNASSGNDRLHPVTILTAQHLHDTPRFQVTPGSDVHQTGPLLVQHHARTISSSHGGWTPQANDVGNVYINQQYPFMSIQNESSEPLAGRSSDQVTVPNTMQALWSNDNMTASADDTFDFGAGGINNAASSSGDIFEELAMLEKTDSTHNPKFMQNLGFGPDLDLAEFFGADYQPSNPLLTFGELPQDLDGNTQGEG